MFPLCEILRNLQGPLQTTYHIYTIKNSSSHFPSKHTSSQEAGCKRRATWAYGGLTCCPQRGGGLGKPRGKGIKSLFNMFHSEIQTLLIYFTRRVHFQAKARINPGGVLCSPPHPIILKASFLSKWHANGPLFPLLRSSITAVWWKRLSGCCWWTFISCEELISPEQTMPLVSIQILFLTNPEKRSGYFKINRGIFIVLRHQGAVRTQIGENCAFSM